MLKTQKKKQDLGSFFLTMWCVAHRINIAMDSIIASLPEMKIWFSNLKSLCTYFQKYSKRKKLLHEKLPDAKEFAAYFEVRFAEHLSQVINTVLHNLESCMEVWKCIQEGSDRLKRDQDEARGFLTVWNQNGLQVFLTAIIGDVCRIIVVL